MHIVSKITLKIAFRLCESPTLSNIHSVIRVCLSHRKTKTFPMMLYTTQVALSAIFSVIMTLNSLIPNVLVVLVVIRCRSMQTPIN